MVIAMRFRPVLVQAGQPFVRRQVPRGPPRQVCLSLHSGCSQWNHSLFSDWTCLFALKSCSLCFLLLELLILSSVCMRWRAHAQTSPDRETVVSSKPFLQTCGALMREPLLVCYVWLLLKSPAQRFLEPPRPGIARMLFAQRVSLPKVGGNPKLPRRTALL